MQPPQPRRRLSAGSIRSVMLSEMSVHVGQSDKAQINNIRHHFVAIGSGAGEEFRPWLRMADGSPLLAHAIMRDQLDVAFMNPSGLLTQAYRGVGLFHEALPVRVVASYPSWDRYAHAIHPRTGISSLAQVKEQRYPLRISIREDATHSTRYLLDQILALYGFSLGDLVAWGGSLQGIGGPGDPRRLEAARGGEIDAIFDEGIRTWLDVALAAGMRAVGFEEPVLQALEALGWRRATIPAGGQAGNIPHLTEEYVGIDYGGWPLYTRASLPDEDVYLLCESIAARAEAIPWEAGAYTGIEQLYQETDATPRDVPLHPGAERWCREHGIRI